MIHVAAAIIKNQAGEILVCKRGAGGSCAYLWEFPGGKQEPEEAIEACLIRECQEELGIAIDVQGIYGQTVYQYPEQEISLTFINATLKQGVPKLCVHEDLAWLAPSALACYEFCPADKEIVRRLESE